MMTLTRRAEKIISYAAEEAAKRGYSCLLTEHLLLALLRETDSDAARVLAYRGIARDELRLALEAKMETVGPPFTGESVLSPRLAFALERAQAEADSFGHKFAGTEYLLLGLIAERNGLAARLLAKQDLTLERAREAVIEALWDGRDVRVKAASPRVPAPLSTLANVGANQELTQAIALIYRAEKWGWRLISPMLLMSIWGALLLATLTFVIYPINIMTLMIYFFVWCNCAFAMTQESKAALFLSRNDNKAAIRPLIRILHWHDPKLKAGAVEALTRLLPTLQANDGEILTPHDRIALGAKLHPRRVPKSPEFALAILTAFEQVGFASCVPYVKPLTLRQPKTPTETRVYEAANRCLRAIEWRTAHQDAHWTLLRASGSSADSPDILLRPAAAAGTADPATMLRPSDAPESEGPRNPPKETI